MKICAIDSSGLVAGVAIVDDDITIAEYTIQHQITHSQTLMPMLADIVDRIGLKLDEIDAYAVAAGPGSFTGLRIGAATVKGLGLAMNKPVVNVPTLEALAYNAYGITNQLICPIMDARRQQVYSGIYRFEFDSEGKCHLKVVKPQMAVAFTELCQMLNSYGERALFIGDGIPVYHDVMKEELNIPYALAPAHMNRQRAASLGSLAIKYMTEEVNGLEGSVTSADDADLNYLRMSQAERERKEREANG